MFPGGGDLKRCANVGASAPRFRARVAATCLVAVSVGALSAVEMASPACAQAISANTAIGFDIPAQPLARALVAYGAVTGLEVFYNASLAGGVQSERVVGLMTPEAALQRLLQGTAYIAKTTGPGTFTITRASREEATSPARAAGRRQFEPYFAALQRGISDTLCRAGPAAASRELVFRFWMSPSGVVERVDVLTDNGDRADDQSFAMPIRGLVLTTPPAELPQPINMVIFPPTPGSSSCGDRHTGRRAGLGAP